MFHIPFFVFSFLKVHRFCPFKLSARYPCTMSWPVRRLCREEQLVVRKSEYIASLAGAFLLLCLVKWRTWEMQVNCSGALTLRFRPLLSLENVGYKQRLRLRSENPELTSVGPSLRHESLWNAAHKRNIKRGLHCNSIRHLLLSTNTQKTIFYKSMYLKVATIQCVCDHCSS